MSLTLKDCKEIAQEHLGNKYLTQWANTDYGHSWKLTISNKETGPKRRWNWVCAFHGTDDGFGVDWPFDKADWINRIDNSIAKWKPLD